MTSAANSIVSIYEGLVGQEVCVRLHNVLWYVHPLEYRTHECVTVRIRAIVVPETVFTPYAKHGDEIEFLVHGDIVRAHESRPVEFYTLQGTTWHE